ncbi:hypothetical protein ACOMHN_031973 [Nucella lapillus]
MDKTAKVQTVVRGEASESDEEEEREVQNPSLKRVQPFLSRVLPSKPLSSPVHDSRARQVAGGQAVVVAGEASESEEEEVDTADSEAASSDLPPLKVEQSKKLERESSSDLSDVPMLISPRMADSRFNKPKYDTLLHRKLRENNWQLHEHMVEIAGQTYLGAARNLSSTTAHLAKSHTMLQDISHSMRLLTNDLFRLDDCIDIVQSCTLLPSINIPVLASPLESASVPHTACLQYHTQPVYSTTHSLSTVPHTACLQYHTQPVYSTTQPVYSTTQPVYSTTQPVYSTTQPVDSTTHSL